MEPTDLPLGILHEIRAEVRATNARLDRTDDRLDRTLSANGVLIEDMRSQMHLVLEAVITTRTELKAELAALRLEQSERSTLLEGIIRQQAHGARN